MRCNSKIKLFQLFQRVDKNELLNISLHFSAVKVKKHDSILFKGDFQFKKVMMEK